jgi:predicted ATPase/DNA-binding SARP family transcriptional activator
MARLSLSFLGSPLVTLDGQPVTGFGYDKVRALLTYLAIEADRPHRRDALTGLLWPELTDSAARTNLRRALANLRHAIDDHPSRPPFLLITYGTIQFNTASDHWLDIAAFTARLFACKQHSHRHPETCKPCIQRLEQAVGLYRGSFLTGFSLPDSPGFEEWALLKREEISHHALDALTLLATAYERRQDYELARRYAMRQLELDSLREEAHRQLMRILVLSGQRNAALAQYETCRRILADELGIEPNEETTALYDRIRSVAWGAPPVESFFNLSAVRLHHFPTQPTSFVGREEELAALADLLTNPSCRLVTIIGPGGIGKTRLALQAATEQHDTFAQGVYFVPLAPLNSAEFLVGAIADAFHFSFSGREDPKAELLSYLREKELLLVLDNFEHLLAGVEFLSEMLQYAPTVHLLVTSRERLRLQWEWLFDLEGLSYPESETTDGTDGVEGYSAVQLFLQRARQAWRHFALTDGQHQCVVQLCQLVAGMPLAIELAAAWVRERACEEIAQEIERNLGTLTTPLQDVPARHRSLRAVVDHSWNRLSNIEQSVLRKLSVFRGGFQPDTAMYVAGATKPLLSTLVDKSLIRRSATERYDIHEFIRQYAADKLREGEEAELTRSQHLTYFLEFAEIAEPKLHETEQREWLARLDTEHDNLRSALEWSQAVPEHKEMGLRLAAALWQFWAMRGYLSEGREWLASALSETEPQQTVARARAFNAAGYLAYYHDDYITARVLHAESLRLSHELDDTQNKADAVLGLRIAESRLSLTPPDPNTEQALFEEPLALFRALNDQWGVARALNSLGDVARKYGDYDIARARHEESLAISRALGDKRTIARTFNFLGRVAQDRGDLEAARMYYQDSLVNYQDIEEVWGIAGAHTNIGEIARQQGDDTTAAAHYTESLRLCQDMGNKSGIGLGLHNLGYVALHQADYEQAETRFTESLKIYQEVGRKKHIAMCLVGLGGVASAVKQPERAARLFGTAEAVYEATGEHIDPADRVEYESNVTAARALLPPRIFAAAWDAGRAMPLEQAIAYATEM